MVREAHEEGRRGKLTALAALAREHRAELRADFRRYYGISFERMLAESPTEAADMAVMLPRGSRTLAAIDPELSWTQETYLLAAAVNALHTLVWMQSRDGSKGRNRPRPIRPPSRASRRDDGGIALEADEYARLLALPREETDYG